MQGGDGEVGVDVAGERGGFSVQPDGGHAGVLGTGDVGTEAVADHGGAGGIAAELLEGDLHGAGMGFADADFARDHDGLEVGPQAGCIDLEVLEVGGAVGDQPERQAAGESGQEVGGVEEHGVALAAFVSEAPGQMFGVGRIVDAVLG